MLHSPSYSAYGLSSLALALSFPAHFCLAQRASLQIATPGNTKGHNNITVTHHPSTREACFVSCGMCEYQSGNHLPLWPSQLTYAMHMMPVRLPQTEETKRCGNGSAHIVCRPIVNSSRCGGALGRGGSDTPSFPSPLQRPRRAGAKEKQFGGWGWGSAFGSQNVLILTHEQPSADGDWDEELEQVHRVVRGWPMARIRALAAHLPERHVGRRGCSAVSVFEVGSRVEPHHRRHRAARPGLLLSST